MKKSKTFILCILLCGVLSVAGLVTAYAQQEGFEGNDSTNVSEQSPIVEEGDESEVLQEQDEMEIAPPDSDPIDIEPLIPEEVEEPIEASPEENQDVLMALASIQASMDAHITDIANLLGAFDGYRLIAGEDNFDDALAIYAIYRSQTENYPYGVTISDSQDLSELLSIYWSLNQVHASNNADGAVIRITRLSPSVTGALDASNIDVFNALTSK